MGVLDALLGAGRVELEEAGREGELEGGTDPGPHVLGLEGVEAREGLEGGGEVVARLLGGVGLDGHEDGEAVEGGRDVLGGGAGGVLRCNKVLDGARVVSRCPVQGGEAVRERAVGRAHWGPVRDFRHVERGDGQDVQEALVAPGGEVAPEVVRGGRGVEAQDGVRDVELVLARGVGRGEVESREVPVKVREGLGELVGLEAREGRD